MAENNLSTREILLNAANRLFAQQGYTATTIRDIAMEAGVNQALVSYHFAGKEGLYAASLERVGKARLHQVQRILTEAQTFEEFCLRLQIFSEDFLQCCIDEPEAFKILNREFEKDLASPGFDEIFQQTCLQTFHTLVCFIKDAVKKQVLRSDIDAEITASIIFSTLNNLIRLDPMRRKFFSRSLHNEDYRKKMIQQYMKIITGGLKLS